MSAGRVLVIEDDAGVANLLRRGLELKGIEVTIAENGSTGREVWESGDFDLVLLDVMLPEIDSINLCAEMRAANDETPVILLTARDEVETQEVGGPDPRDALVLRVIRLLGAFTTTMCVASRRSGRC